MNSQFNNQQFYVLPTQCIFVFCVDLRTAIIYLIISIQPLGRFWQEPEPIQATDMTLARCILGKFLGIVCHCCPLLFTYTALIDWFL
jgi:hypothetical protein